MRGDQAEDAEGAAPAARAVAADGRLTVETADVCLNSEPRLVSLWLTRYTTRQWRSPESDRSQPESFGTRESQPPNLL
jgi:hypothetical protein